MNTFGHTEKPTGCLQAQSLLSDYVDNTLSARQVLDVEKHLTDCPDCAALAREMRTTVSLLRSSARFDTDNDFMAKLHARLDGLEPEAAHPRLTLATARDWFASVRGSLRARRVPALSLGVAATAIIAFIVLPHTPASNTDLTNPLRPGTGSPSPIAADTLRRNVALAASNPFEDPAAANLAAHAALKENGATETVTP
jgi:hypothetical protein